MDDKLTRIIVIKDGANIGMMDVAEKEMEAFFNAPQNRPEMPVEVLLHCESPIERLLAVSLAGALVPKMNYIYRNMDYNEVLTEITPQYVICIGKDNKYRCDLFLSVSFILSDSELIKVECVIECDGHDFHEKTKEQVARGKRRDRDLISMGYDVIHFSGSEIWHDVDACSQYICDFIEKKHDRLLEQLRKA
jgi:hypothetical protein